MDIGGHLTVGNMTVKFPYNEIKASSGSLFEFRCPTDRYTQHTDTHAAMTVITRLTGVNHQKSLTVKLL